MRERAAGERLQDDGFGRATHFDSIRRVLAYLVRRMLWAVVLIFALTLLTYVIFFVIPRDPAQFRRVQATGATDLDRAFDLHGSFFAQYGQFVWNFLAHGSLGHSFAARRDVSSMLADAAPVTASLLAGGALMAIAIGLLVGITSAVRPRSLYDRGAMVFVLFGISVHPLWVGLVLSYFFGFKWHIVPISGYCDLVPEPGGRCGGLSLWAYHLLLPWLTFAVVFAALYARMIRASVIETYDEEYVRAARAKGGGRLHVLRVHVLRNALLPVVTMLGMDLGVAFAGSIFVERVYGLPGMGTLLVRSATRSDLPPIVGIVVVVTIAVILFSLIVDLLYAWIDPRVRVSARAESR